ncbi:MAG: aldehyde dehydrogenase family protein [Vicingaceae bacterium]
MADEKIIDEAINKAVSIKKTLKNLPSYKRFEALKYISEEIKAKREFLAELIALESGKPLIYALGEVDRSVQTFLIAAEESKRLPKEYISLDWTPPGTNKEGIIKYFPVGIVAGITPFNFPINLVAHKVAPAIAAGCPIIIKPASATPLSCLELAKIIDQTDLPKGVLSVLPMNRKTGNYLIQHPNVSMISFTGSPAVGWQIKLMAGKKKVTLELGGNAGCLIGKVNDLETVVKKCVTGAFAYSGQVCIHTQRIFVLEDLYEAFLTQFVKETKTLTIGNPTDTTTEISAMIDEKNTQRVLSWIDEAVKGGAKVVYGGHLQNNILEPTILTATKSNMKVNCEEVFGPVVIIEKVSTFKEGLEELNHSKFGLQAGVFTNNIEEMDLAFNELEVGGVILNDVPTFRVDHMPYGGIKDSGFGREGVKYAIIDMMEPKILVK